MFAIVVHQVAFSSIRECSIIIWVTETHPLPRHYDHFEEQYTIWRNTFLSGRSTFEWPLAPSATAPVTTVAFYIALETLETLETTVAFYIALDSWKQSLILEVHLARWKNYFSKKKKCVRRLEKIGEVWRRMEKVSKVPNTNLIVPGSMALQCDSVMEPRLQF